MQGVKNNLDETRCRFDDFWAGKPLKTPITAIYGITDWENMPPSSPPDKTDCASFYLDTDGICRRMHQKFSRVRAYGDGVPLTSAYMGPGGLGVYCGCEPVFAPDTVWYKPLEDISAPIKLQTGSKYYKWSLETTRALKKQGEGLYITATPDLIENLDVSASLAGTENLLYMMYDAPSEVHRIQRQVQDAWRQCYDAHYDIIRSDDGYGACDHFLVWGRGRCAKVQNDFSYMISPGMYDEFALPYHIEQFEHLAGSVYHLDGPGAIVHLPSLLSIKKLRAVQWVPGAGNTGCADEKWDSLYRRILDAGKAVYVNLALSQYADFVKRYGSNCIIDLGFHDDAAAREFCKIHGLGGL